MTRFLLALNELSPWLLIFAAVVARVNDVRSCFVLLRSARMSAAVPAGLPCNPRIESTSISPALTPLIGAT